MRLQTLRRTTLLSLLGLKPAAAQESPAWTWYTSYDSSTTALVESSPTPLASASSSTETLVATPTSSQIPSPTSGSTNTVPQPLTSNVSFIVSLPKPTEEPITMSALDSTTATPRTNSSSTLSSVSDTGVTSTAAPPTAGGSSLQTTESRTTSSSRRTTAVLIPSGATAGPRATGDAAPMSYLRMGMMGALGAAAGLVMI